MSEPFRYGDDQLEAFVHDILTYRYNFHNGSYEIDIVLTGSMDFVRGGQHFHMEEDDIIITNPGVGHTSMALEPDTTAMVLHFPASIFRDLLDNHQVLDFHFASGRSTRNEPRCRHLRLFSSLLLRSLAQEDTPCAETARSAALDMLKVTLYTMFNGSVVTVPCAVDDVLSQEKLKEIARYIDENYAQKITLEDLSARFGYNRTYLSTLFKRNFGVNLYDYITDVRFSHASYALLSSDDSLTKVALYNGFPDLKTFNRLFKDFFHLTPAEYRQSAPKYLAGKPYGFRNFRNINESPIREKLDEYALL